MAPATRVLGFTILALAALWGLQGCSGAAARPKAEAAVVVFHDQFNADDFDSIWNSAYYQLREANSQADFVKFLQGIHRKLGQVVNTTPDGWQVGFHNYKSTVMLRQKTVFEHGTGEEEFDFYVVGDGVKLVGYHVESKELMTL
jgi:hypothetical protein